MRLGEIGVRVSRSERARTCPFLSAGGAAAAHIQFGEIP